VNGAQLIDNWRDQGSTTASGKITLTAGQPVPIEVQFYQNHGGDNVSFGWQLPASTSLLDDAVALAKSSDVAVVFVSNFETEGADLDDIDLPGGQNQLISAVAAANPRTIVVLNTGSAVTMPWVDAVPAVLEAWYPGQEDGDAIARVLFGDTEPAGRLPVTFPRRLADVPASTVERFPGVGGKVSYGEGLEVGYRWYQARKVAPLFPFGFGLSYTTFRFGNLQVARGTGRTVTVSADVTNTGARPGAEVVQVYVGQPAATGEPPWQLKAFAKVRLAPGETRHVRFTLDARAFAHWDVATDGWVVAPGDYAIGVGNSSANLPLQAHIAPTPGRVD
jgi:beta-glucosidase